MLKCLALVPTHASKSLLHDRYLQADFLLLHHFLDWQLQFLKRLKEKQLLNTVTLLEVAYYLKNVSRIIQLEGKIYFLGNVASVQTMNQHLKR